MKLFISSQYLSCLAPLLCKLDSFKNIAKSIEANVNKLALTLQGIADQRDNESRDMAVQQVASFLADNCASDRMKEGAHLFVASTIIADMEELSKEPFGEVTKIHPAFGGQQGLDTIRIRNDRGEELTNLSDNDKARYIYDAIQMPLMTYWFSTVGLVMTMAEL